MVGARVLPKMVCRQETVTVPIECITGDEYLEIQTGSRDSLMDNGPKISLFDRRRVKDTETVLCTGNPNASDRLIAR